MLHYFSFHVLLYVVCVFFLSFVFCSPPSLSSFFLCYVFCLIGCPCKCAVFNARLNECCCRVLEERKRKKTGATHVIRAVKTSYRPCIVFFCAFVRVHFSLCLLSTRVHALMFVPMLHYSDWWLWTKTTFHFFFFSLFISFSTEKKNENATGIKAYSAS